MTESEVKAAMPEIAVMREEAFRQELNKLREEVQQEAVVETRVAASVFAVSTGLSVGYVLWLLRGGVLIASLLSSIPPGGSSTRCRCSAGSAGSRRGRRIARGHGGQVAGP